MDEKDTGNRRWSTRWSSAAAYTTPGKGISQLTFHAGERGSAECGTSKVSSFVSLCSGTVKLATKQISAHQRTISSRHALPKQ